MFALLALASLSLGQTLLFLPMAETGRSEASAERQFKFEEDYKGDIRGSVTTSGVDLATVGFLFKESLAAKYPGKIVLPDSGEPACAGKDCAAELASKYQADDVVWASVNKLGTKVFFSATLFKVSTGAANIQRLPAAGVEELDDVIRRVTDALLAEKNWKEVATLDNVVEEENRKLYKRRETYFKKGLTLGYLFPMRESYQWRDCTYDYSTSFDETCKTRQYTQMIYFNWMNVWEFQGNLALDVDLNWAIPLDFGADVNLWYLLGRSDFTPFVGGGLGLHYVLDLDLRKGDDDFRHSGPALNVQAGYILFRTYTLNLIARAKYQAVANSNFDNGPVVEVGVVHYNRDNSSSTGMSWWKWLLGLIVFTSIIGAVTD